MSLREIQINLQSDDEEVRRSALHTLEGIPLVETLPLIFIAMGDESWRVRKEAVEALVHSFPDEDTVYKLLQLLRNEENAGLRNSAAEAVIRLGSVVTSPLMKMVNDPDPNFRKFIIDLMGAVWDPQFAEPLLNALNDDDVNVAAAAAEHLGSSGDELVMPDLMRAIISNEAVLFRFSALSALSALGRPSAIPEEILTLADSELLGKAVFNCLGNISDESSIKLLVDKGLNSSQRGSRAAALKAIFRIYGRSDLESRVRIVKSLRKLSGADLIPGLLTLFNTGDSLLVNALIWCSDVTGDTRFIPVLIESFADEHFEQAALKSLRNFGTEGIADAISHYPEANENARSAICTLIGECGYSVYSDLLFSALKDHSPRVRSSAATAVSRLGMVSAIPDLTVLVDEADSHVSSAAVAALQSLSVIDKAGILNIAGRLSVSEQPRQRRNAAFLFASMREHDRLIPLAKDEEPAVREAAVTAIGTLRLKLSGSVLLLALVDENHDVRIAAAEALGNIEDPSNLDALECALEDQDTWVRCAVLKAIARIDRERLHAIIKRVHSVSEGLFLITCLQLLEVDGDPEAERVISHSLSDPDPDIARQASISLQRCRSGRLNSGCL